MNEINIWNEITETVTSLFEALLTATEHAVTETLPRLLLAGATLLLGWLIAIFLRKMTAKGLRGFGFDIILERSGIRPRLSERGVQTAPSALVGWTVYALILYSAFQMAFERMDFQLGLALLATLRVWVPRTLIALLLLAIGHWIGRWLGRIVSRAARVASLPAAPVAGAILHASVMVIAALLAIGHLNLASERMLLIALGFLLLALLGLAALAALCARDLIVSLIAVRTLGSVYQRGDRIRVGEWEGEIIAMHLHLVQLQLADGTVQIPAERLLREPVVKLASQPERHL